MVARWGWKGQVGGGNNGAVLSRQDRAIQVGALLFVWSQPTSLLQYMTTFW